MSVKEKERERSATEVLAELQAKGTIPSTGKIIEKVVKKVGIEKLVESIAEEIINGKGTAKRDFTRMFMELMVRNERNLRRIGDEDLKGIPDEQLEALLKEKLNGQVEVGAVAGGA